MIYYSREGMMLSSGTNQHDRFTRWDMLAGVSIADSCIVPFNSLDAEALNRMQHFINTHPGWCFFHLNYDLKNKIENLTSDNPDRIMFPELAVFAPKCIIGVKGDNITFEGDEEIAGEIRKYLSGRFISENRTPARVNVTTCMKRGEYLELVKAIGNHIQRGDIYEMNFCQEFFCELPLSFSPLTVWSRLSKYANAPFSAFYCLGDHLMFSASPERFLQLAGNRLISQPMKGTIKRGGTPGVDLALKGQLREDPKEQSENVMIVDLVRNDLSRVAKKGSVKVEELFGIYTFATVHQMISTVSCELLDGNSFTDIIKATFPMGSMTGAPKIRAMELIELYERSRRGLFSGSVGYITPEGDFDMNVVIRSIICNPAERICSFQTGGAITSLSNPENEYSESLLKAGGLIKALNGKMLI